MKSSDNPTQSHEFLKIKSEILKEILPILQKLDFKPLKENILKDLNDIIDIEVAKIKTEISSKDSNSKKEFKKHLSEIEFRLVDLLKTNSELKIELRGLKENKLKDFEEFIEQKLKNAFEIIEKKISVKASKETGDTKILGEKIANLQTQIQKLVETQTKNYSIQEEEITSIESKVLKTIKDYEEIKSLLGRYENDLYSKQENELNQIEQKLNKFLEPIKVEFAKTKQELFSKQNTTEQTTKELLNKFNQTQETLKKYESDLKVALNENITKELGSKFTELESKINSEIEQLKKNSNLSQNEFSKNKERLLENFESLKTEIAKTDKNYKQKLTDGLSKIDELISNFKKQTEEIESSLSQNFVKKLAILDEKLEEKSKQIQDTIQNLQEQKSASQDTLNSNYEELKTQLETLENTYEKRIKEDSKKIFDKLDKDYKNKINSFKEEIAELEKNSKELSKKITENLDKNSSTIISDFKQTEQQIEQRIKELEFQITSSIRDLETQKSKERDFILYKTNEVIDSFNRLEENNKISLAQITNSYFEELKEKFAEYKKGIKEEFSKNLLSQNEEFLRLKLENKETRTKLIEDLETRFLNAKEEYEAKFETHLTSFDNTLKQKEQEFIEKVSSFEKEKMDTLDELIKFKDEISKLSQESIEKMTSELENLKHEEDNFYQQKQEFIEQLNSLTNTSKIRLEEYTNSLQTELAKTLLDEKETFERHENTFRSVFTEKISVLHTILDEKLKSIEKKFIEKNIRVIQDKVKAEVQILEDFERKISSNINLFEQKISQVQIKEDELSANLNAKEEKLKEKVEERLITLEKNLNKRFLGLDSDFATFKGVIVDEIESLIREVNKIVTEKIAQTDNLIIKSSFAVTELKKTLDSFQSIKGAIEREISDMRDTLNDVRVKFEIMSPEHYSLQDHVNYATLYESQLLALIESLKGKGLSKSATILALVKKGHPRVYSSMLVDYVFK